MKKINLKVSGIVTVTLKQDIDESLLENKIEDLGYEIKKEA